MIKRSVILISISSIAKAFCDKINFHNGGKFLTSDFWLAKNNFSWDNRSWIEKYIFSFIADGWHLFDMVRILSMLILVSYLFMLIYSEEQKRKFIDRYNCLYVVLVTITLYVLHGLVFEIVFNLL